MFGTLQKRLPQEGGPGQPDPSGPRARPTRRRTDPGLFTRGPGALGAHVRDPAEAPAPGAQARRHHRHGRSHRRRRSARRDPPAFADGYRGRTQSWREALLDLNGNIAKGESHTLTVVEPWLRQQYRYPQAIGAQYPRRLSRLSLRRQGLDRTHKHYYPEHISRSVDQRGRERPDRRLSATPDDFLPRCSKFSHRMTDNFEKKVAVDGHSGKCGRAWLVTFSPGQALPAGPLRTCASDQGERRKT